MLKIEYLEDEIPVYDITVEGTHNFFANDILIHNCTEICEPTSPIESLDDVGKVVKMKIKVPKNKVNEYLEHKKNLGGYFTLN